MSLETAAPTRMQVRNEGIKVDIITMEGVLSSLRLEYNRNAKSEELLRWLGIARSFIKKPSHAGDGTPLIDSGAFFNSLGEGTESGAPRIPTSLALEVRCDGLKINISLAGGKLDGLVMDYRSPHPVHALAEWICAFQPPPVATESRDSQGIRQHDSSPSPEKGALSLALDGEEEQPASTEPALDRRAVMEAVDKALDQLGKDGKQVILSLLEKRYGLREEDIPDHLRAFEDILHELLGSGSEAILSEVEGEMKSDPQVKLEGHREGDRASGASLPVESGSQSRAIVLSSGPKPIVVQEFRDKPDPIPKDFKYAFDDPRPIGFKYYAAFSISKG